MGVYNGNLQWESTMGTTDFGSGSAPIGNLQWESAMGDYNESLQWESTMGIYTGNLQWESTMRVYNGSKHGVWTKDFGSGSALTCLRRIIEDH